MIVGGVRDGRFTQGADRLLWAGLWSPFVSQTLTSVLSAARPEDLALVRGHLADGTVTPVVGRTYTLGELPEAIRHVRDGHATGKAVLTI